MLVPGVIQTRTGRFKQIAALARAKISVRPNRFDHIEHVAERIAEKPRRIQRKRVGQFGEENVRRFAADKVAVGQAQQLFADVGCGILVIVADPEQPVVERRERSNLVNQRIVLAAVAGDDHRLALHYRIDHRFDPISLGLQFVFGIEQKKAGVLAVKMKDCAVSQIGSVEPDLVGPLVTQSGKIVDRWKPVKQCACPRGERIEIRCQYCIEHAAGFKPGNANMRPVDLGLFDVFADQVDLHRRRQCRHAIGIAWLPSFPAGHTGFLKQVGMAFCDPPHKILGQTDSSAFRNACSRQNAQFVGSACRFTQNLGNFFNPRFRKSHDLCPP